MTFEIWIRTHTERLPFAYDLKQRCEQLFGVQAKLIHTGDAAKTYSIKYVIKASDQLNDNTSEYILMLEDDMLFSHKANGIVRKIVHENKRSHTWFSVPNMNILHICTKISEDMYILTGVDTFWYSGAILIKKDLLKKYLTFYLLNVMSLDTLAFDLSLSSFIIKENSHLILTPSYFASDPKIETSISDTQLGRVVQNIEILDPLYDYNSTFTQKLETSFEYEEKSTAKV